MDRKAFSLLHNMEDSWWYRGRSVVIDRALGTLKASPTRILDIGAGFGGMADVLHTHGSELEGTEPDQASRDEAKRRGYREMYAELDEVTPPYDLAVLFDVFEHVEDDHALAQKINQLLNQDGSIAMTVPAFKWLWSEHDVLHHHYRRYTTREVKTLLEQAGFEILYCSYWNMLLFFPAALVRMTGNSGAASLSLPKFLDALFFLIVKVESWLMPWASLPFGTGIVAVAQKRSHGH
jgi:SAM-dependent methyltransferase